VLNSPVQIASLDHLVLTVRDTQATCEFYAQVLGMQVITFGDNRRALKFGQQRINLHQAGQEFEPKADHPTPGSADLCFLTETPIAQVISDMQAQGISIEAGIVPRTGATGAIRSIYIRDPDGNLIELANPV
jgi:catechol 2,3-dioxygenase-like lactoylglutathione lyase family enzyme